MITDTTDSETAEVVVIDLLFTFCLNLGLLRLNRIFLMRLGRQERENGGNLELILHSAHSARLEQPRKWVNMFLEIILL